MHTEREVIMQASGVQDSSEELKLKIYNVLGGTQTAVGAISLVLGSWAIVSATDELRRSLWSPFWIGCLEFVNGYIFVQAIWTLNKKLIVLAVFISLASCVCSMGIGCYGFTFLLISPTNQKCVYYGILIAISLLSLVISSMLAILAWKIREFEYKRERRGTRVSERNTAQTLAAYGICENHLVYFGDVNYLQNATHEAPPPYEA